MNDDKKTVSCISVDMETEDNLSISETIEINEHTENVIGVHIKDSAAPLRLKAGTSIKVNAVGKNLKSITGIKIGD